MMRSILATAVLSLALAPLTAATGQTAQSDCPPEAKPLPAELANWTSRTVLTAADRTSALNAAALRPGHAVALSLQPTPDVDYALSPERPPGPASHGGMARVTIERAGTYRVALGSAAWIDVVRDGKALASVGHGHGPACSDIRKMVDFRLEPGAYVLQIAGSAAPAINLLVAPLP